MQTPAGHNCTIGGLAHTQILAHLASSQVDWDVLPVMAGANLSLMRWEAAPRWGAPGAVMRGKQCAVSMLG